MRKLLSWTAILAASVYVLGLGALSACQRSMMYFPTADVVAPTLPGVEAVRIDTSDGEHLVAWYAAPARGQPVFLYFDGNGGRPEMWDLRWRAITDHGAGFLAVYYRGYSGSTGHPTEQGLHRDAEAGYAWLIAHNYRPGDIVIHGFSLGTGVATKLASEHPARALVLEAPFSAAVDVAHERFPFLPVSTIMSDQYRSREWIANVHMPVLVAHGDADNVVPFAQGQHLFALASEPKTFVHMPGSGHTSLTRDGLYPHIWRFLDQHPG